MAALLVSGLCLSAARPPRRKLEFVVKPVAEKKLKQLPAGPLYWLVENFPTLAQAQAAAARRRSRSRSRARSGCSRSAPRAARRPAPAKVVEVGPVPPITAAEYLLRINNSFGPPGSKTPVHTHPGSEAFYVLTGRLGQKTPHGVSHAEAGKTMNGHGADMPMEVFSSGTSDMNALVMFVVDASRPFSSPATFP